MRHKATKRLQRRLERARKTSRLLTPQATVHACERYRERTGHSISYVGLARAAERALPVSTDRTAGATRADRDALYVMRGTVVVTVLDWGLEDSVGLWVDAVFGSGRDGN